MKSQYPYIGPINVHLRCTQYTHTHTHTHSTYCVAETIQPEKFTNAVLRGFVEAQLVKNLPAMQETQVQLLGREDSLEKGRREPLPTPVFWPLFFSLKNIYLFFTKTLS